MGKFDYQIDRELMREPFTDDEIELAKAHGAEMARRYNECRVMDGIIYNDDAYRQEKPLQADAPRCHQTPLIK